MISIRISRTIVYSIKNNFTTMIALSFRFDSDAALFLVYDEGDGSAFFKFLHCFIEALCQYSGKLSIAGGQLRETRFRLAGIDVGVIRSEPLG